MLIHGNVNYIAIFISAIVAFVIGALWYSPLLFGPLWAREHGYTDEYLKANAANFPKAMAVSFVTYLVTAYVLALLFGFLPVHSLAMALCASFILWLGFPAAIGLMNAMYTNKSLIIYAIDSGYQLVYILATGVILFLWK